MKLFATSILSLISIAGTAQNYVGIKPGINIATMVGGDSPVDLGWRGLFCGGITYEHFFDERQSIQIDLLYNQRGYQAVLQSNGSKSNFNVNFNYVSLPVKDSFYLGPENRFFVAGGIVPSVLTDANLVADPPPANSPRKTRIVDDSIAKFDVAIQLEVGLLYPLTDKYSAYGSTSFQHSITDVNANGTGFRHLGATISAGIKMKLGAQ